MSDLETLTNAVFSRIFIEMEASGRHVHVNREQAQILFGHSLTPSRPLSQPGQFLARERVSIEGPKGVFSNVAVLGPERTEAQVEVSLTDSKTLGLKPPVRLSGNTKGSPGIRLIGPEGKIDLPEGVIAAQRHIHLTPRDAIGFGVTDRQVVKLQTLSSRPVIFDDVIVRVDPNFAPRVHLDYDEANACGFQPGDLGRIIP